LGRRIKIINLHKAYRLNESLLKRIILQILGVAGKPELKEFNFIFLCDKNIKTFNKKYKGSSRATDVLSFYIHDDLGRTSDIGEIFISVDRALENSHTFGTGFQEELVLYVIHGVLHLFGYDDRSAKERRRMRDKESEIMGKICTKENLLKVLTRR
jgi:probable rRNA maturation factor